jgi:hypothetical protein
MNTDVRRRCLLYSLVLLTRSTHSFCCSLATLIWLLCIGYYTLAAIIWRNLPTYLSTCLPAYLPTCLPTYLPAYLPTYSRAPKHLRRPRGLERLRRGVRTADAAAAEEDADEGDHRRACRLLCSGEDVSTATTAVVLLKCCLTYLPHPQVQPVLRVRGGQAVRGPALLQVHPAGNERELHTPPRGFASVSCSAGRHRCLQG